MADPQLKITLMLPYPEKVTKGDGHSVAFEAELHVDGQVQKLGSGTATIPYIVDGDGDLIPNVNPLVGDLVGRVGLGSALGDLFAGLGLDVGIGKKD